MNFYDLDYKTIDKYVTNQSCKIIVKGDYYILVTKKDSLIIHYSCFDYKRDKAILKLWPGEVEE